MHTNQFVRNWMSKHPITVAKTATLPEAQQIRKFLLLYKQLDADDGELTRTRKVRRGVIKEKYAEIIDAVYAGQQQVHIDTVITFQDGNKSRVQTDVRVVDLNPGAGEENPLGKPDDPVADEENPNHRCQKAG